jgi:hypothetical protein
VPCYKQIRHPLLPAVSLISARIAVIVSSHPSSNIANRHHQQRLLQSEPNNHDFFSANGLRVLQSPFMAIPPNHQTPPAHQADRGDIGKIFPQAKRLVWTRLVRTPNTDGRENARETVTPSRSFSVIILCGLTILPSVHLPRRAKFASLSPLEALTRTRKLYPGISLSCAMA